MADRHPGRRGGHRDEVVSPERRGRRYGFLHMITEGGLVGRGCTRRAGHHLNGLVCLDHCATEIVAWIGEQFDDIACAQRQQERPARGGGGDPRPRDDATQRSERHRHARPGRGASHSEIRTHALPGPAAHAIAARQRGAWHQRRCVVALRVAAAVQALRRGLWCAGGRPILAGWAAETSRLDRIELIDENRLRADEMVGASQGLHRGDTACRGGAAAGFEHLERIDPRQIDRCDRRRRDNRRAGDPSWPGHRHLCSYGPRVGNDDSEVEDRPHGGGEDCRPELTTERRRPWSTLLQQVGAGVRGSGVRGTVRRHVRFTDVGPRVRIHVRVMGRVGLRVGLGVFQCKAIRQHRGVGVRSRIGRGRDIRAGQAVGPVVRRRTTGPHDGDARQANPSVRQEARAALRAMRGTDGREIHVHGSRPRRRHPDGRSNVAFLGVNRRRASARLLRPLAFLRRRREVPEQAGDCGRDDRRPNHWSHLQESGVMPMLCAPHPVASRHPSPCSPTGGGSPPVWATWRREPGP